MAGFLKFSSIALKNLFSKPATRNYPDMPPKSTAATRGSVQIDIDQCVFCGLCMRRCPSEAITVDRTAKTWSIERMGCVQCADCVSICPKKSLSMNPKYTPPSSSKTVSTYRKSEPEATPAEMIAANKSDSVLLMNIDDCVLCGLCVKQCPVGALKVDRETKTWSIERSECLLCSACAQRCPKKCLSVGQMSGEIPSIYAKTDSPTVITPAKPASPTLSEAVSTSDRTAVQINMEHCVLCGLCVKQCPVGALKVDREAKTWSIERSECLLCGVCARRCPKKCLEIGDASDEIMQTSVYTKPLSEAPVRKALPHEPTHSEAAETKQTVVSKSALQLNLENCVFCGLCAKQCPEEAIKIDRAAKSWTIDRSACLLCAACVQRCPKKSLRIGETDEALLPSTYTKESVPTVPAPEAADASATRQVMIGIENCVLCGMCVKQCPVGAIKVDRDSKSWTINREACMLCSACVQRCPKKCLGIGHASDTTAQTSTYTKA